MDEEVEYYPSCSDVEVDSDHDDQDAEKQLGDWLGQLETLKMGLDSSEDTGTVKRRNKTVVTPKMAMESFRYSFLNSDEPQDVNLDAILGELCELENQLTTTQSELSETLGRNSTINNIKDDNRDSGNDFIQAELDALAAEIQSATGPHFLTVGDIGYDVGEADSAFSDNTSLPSSESFTSMATVSSSADTSSSASGETASTNSTTTLTAASFLPQSEGVLHDCDYDETIETQNSVTQRHIQNYTIRRQFDNETIVTQNERAASERIRSQLSPRERQWLDEIDNVYVFQEEQKARLKAEKIRIALEKIKEAKIRKLFVRAFTQDGSSKSILVDEKMTVGMVCNVLAEKNHIRLSDRMTVVEQLPELYMERILEDHDSLVENMVMWTRDSKNKILYEERTEKYDLFRNPEKYLLLGSSSEKGTSLDPSKRHRLLQEFFSGVGVPIPEVEGVLYLKTDGKKAWKKYFFVLRGSGLYYNPKGKISKSSKDLSCLIQFDLVEVYKGLGWKKKYNAPTDYCFALKHPQVQRKTSKYMSYLCAENKSSMEAWMMGIRIAKSGRQLLENYERVRSDIILWDRREPWTNQMMEGELEQENTQSFNRDDLNDSRLSVPEPDRHSIITVTNCSTASNSPRPISSSTEFDDGIFMSDGANTIQRSPHYHQNGSESPQKTPVKRVSFSTTHCVINADSCEDVVHMHHRDSITSASTDTSDESTSSGEGRSLHPRGKMRAKIPVTTETTRQISGMVQLAMENTSISSVEGTIMERKSSVSSCGSGSNIERSTLQRRKSAPQLHSPTTREIKTEIKLTSPTHQIYAPLAQPATPTSPHNMPSPLKIYDQRPVSSPMSPSTQTHQKRPSMSSLQGDSKDSPPRSPVPVTPPVPPATLPGVPVKKMQSNQNVMSCPPIKKQARAPTPPKTSSHAPPTPPKGHVRRTSGGPVPVPPPTVPVTSTAPSHEQIRLNGSAMSDARASCGMPPPPPPGRVPSANGDIPPPPSVTSIYNQPAALNHTQGPFYGGIPPSPCQMVGNTSPAPGQMSSSIPPSPSQMSGGMPSPPHRVHGAMHTQSPSLSPQRMYLGTPPPPPPSAKQKGPPPAPPVNKNISIPPAPSLSGPSQAAPVDKPVLISGASNVLPPPVAAKPGAGPPVAPKKPSSGRPSQYAVPKPPAVQPSPVGNVNSVKSPQDDAVSPVSPSGTGLPFLSELAQKSKQPKVVPTVPSESKGRFSHSRSEDMEQSSPSKDASHYAQLRAGIAKHFDGQRGSVEANINGTPKQIISPVVPCSPTSVPNKPLLRGDSKVSNRPPPPRRSESTRLSTRGPKGKSLPQQEDSPTREVPPQDVLSKSLDYQPDSGTQQTQQQHNMPNGLGKPAQFDGILPIEDLPPPPPELLEGLPPSPSSHSAPGKKPKPPPPPPKRNKDTQLTCS